MGKLMTNQLFMEMLDRGQVKEVMDIVQLYTRERLSSPSSFETWYDTVTGYHEPPKSRYPTNRR